MRRTRAPKPETIGLVCAGGIRDEWLVRTPVVLDALRKVKAPSLAAASRAAREARAGVPVASVENLADCSIILIAVPARSAAAALLELLDSRIAWQGKLVWAVGSPFDIEEWQPLADRGAAIATVDQIFAQPDHLLLQGDAQALHRIRPMLPPNAIQHEVAPGSKAVFLAGLTFAASLVIPALAAGIDCFDRIGLSKTQSLALVSLAQERAARSFMRVGKKNWSGPLGEQAMATELDAQSLAAQHRALMETDTALVSYFRASAEASLDYLRKPSPWPGRSQP